MAKKIDYSNKIGEKILNKRGVEMEIIGFRSYNDIDICFEDGTHKNSISYGAFKSGSVSNPNSKTVSGVGYIGVGDYWVSKDGSMSNIYIMWKHMIERCYAKNYRIRCPTYSECTVSEEFHNYQNFASFYYENKWGNNIKLVPDKDILTHGKNKIYSRDTICFVTQEINNLFTKTNSIRGKCPIGVIRVKDKFMSRISINGRQIHLGTFKDEMEAFYAYKNAKESYLKNMADTYKIEHDDFPVRVYNAMYDYKVSIDD